ncbi:MGH1-like glycoside hydrolase domain-containing protein [Hymenobacter baengnokdamensis]|uniref:MGH1-like glycoside hydrolase domain-containing protein n=1 Tax=Hymenobacter baengnokdamensis TaxID=2615203 RepID=UPI0017862C59|nr:trehalase family glycosidase [Hymenobacter baengnokdamensis]
MLSLLLLPASLTRLSAQAPQPARAAGSWAQLSRDAGRVGKPAWRPMLRYVAALHQKATHPAAWPFDYEWEDLGPGYVYGNAFGHWDVVHEALDVLPSYPEHALHQLLNDTKNQEPNGLVPGSIYMPGGLSGRDSVRWNKDTQGHPPLWPLAVQEYVHVTRDSAVVKRFYTPLVRQLTWFENNRKVESGGFFYNDILLKKWESGVDEGIRFDEVAPGALACVDATSHVYALYTIAAQWARQLGLDAAYYEKRAAELRAFIQTSLYVPADGMFYDSWAVKNPALRNLPFESMWPLVTGAATQAQADRYIDTYLLNKEVFLTEHPIATVGRRDPKFELRMWRGPAWNSMAYWAARGCLRYGRRAAARLILEKALDDSARQFERTGTIWEFYNPLGGKPEDVKRKPTSKYNQPCRDYLGHNPVIEMARLYDSLK